MRIVFSGHDFKFIQPFVRWCQVRPGYEVKLDQHRGHVIDSEQTAQEMADWADIIFCEWALGNSVWYSRNKRPNQKLIVRLHLQEIQGRLPYLWDTNWEMVDHLVMICHHMYDWMIENFPEAKEKIRVIYNPIDAQGVFSLDRSPFADFNLGMVGIVPQRKRFDLALDILEALRGIDQRFTLKVKGRRPEEYSWMINREEEMRYYRSQYERIEASTHPHAVVFEPHGSDMASWYSRVGFILSTSDFEGSHQAIAEGMAAGCIPVIRNWQGAARMYPEKYVVSTVDEAVELVRQTKQDPLTYSQHMAFCRQYTVERFDQREVCEQLGSLLGSVDGTALAGNLRLRVVAGGRDQEFSVAVIGYVPRGAQGGYRIRIEQEIRGLVDMGVNVVFVCLYPATPDDAPGPDEFGSLPPQCEVVFHTVQGFFDFSFPAETLGETLQPLINKLRQRTVRVLHAEALYAARFALQLKERDPSFSVVFDCHGTVPDEESMTGQHAVRVKASEAWEKRLLAQSDLVVFVSEAMESHYHRKYGLSPRGSLVIPSCVDGRWLSDAAQPNSQSDTANRMTIGYVGTLAAWQCSREMFALFGSLRRAGLDVFFQILTPRRYHEEARRSLEQQGIDSSDYLLTEVIHDEVADYVRRMDVGLLLRRNSPVNRVSSPTKFGEYLACGVPVLLTDCVGDYSGVAELEGVGYVIESDLLDDLESEHAEVVKRVLAFLEHVMADRASYAGRCRAFAKKSLSWTPHLKHLAKCYETLASRESREWASSRSTYPAELHTE